MIEDRPERILGAALVQGALDWTELRNATMAAGEEGADPHLMLGRLMVEGILTETVLAGLLGTQSGEEVEEDPDPDEVTQMAPRPSSDAMEESLGVKVHKALAIPTWRQYRNLRFIGEGGMGRIYKGWDTSLRRMVALKFLRRAEPEMVARFMQEAQLQAGVEHPNICRVYEVSEWHGEAYIAMQFIQGEPLDMCAEHLTLREKVQVMEVVAEAIHVAHRQGLIHRDLKPANIMVEVNEGKEPKPYVLDFGLARGLESSGLTVEGVVVGTYHFMAPEQAMGQTRELDRRTDIYALGATLYAILADKPPFWESEGLECARRTVEEDPTPIRKLAPEVPEDLNTIVMKCLEKAPDRRYESARAFAEDLRRFLDDEPILAHRPTLRYRLGKYARRHKTIVTISTIALVAVLGAGTLGISSWLTARARAYYAQTYGQEAERMEALARYTYLLPAHDIRPEIATLRKRLDHLEQNVKRTGRLAAGPGAYAQGRGHLALGEMKEALAHFQEALSKGYDGPELRFAMGRVQGQLYQAAMQTAVSIGDPHLQKSEMERADKEWRQPALANLQKGAGVSVYGLEYEQALLEFYSRNYEAALKQARQAFQKAPWFYEAKRLEGEILHAQALMDQAAWRLKTLRESVDVFQKARYIAPSDPAIPIGEARAWRDTIGKQVWLGHDENESMKACIAAAKNAQALNPELSECESIISHSFSLVVSGKDLKGMNYEKEIEAVEHHADLALAIDPDNSEAIRAKMTTVVKQGMRGMRKNIDPIAYITRLKNLNNRYKVSSPQFSDGDVMMVKLLRFRFTYLTGQGLDGSLAFEEALDLINGVIKSRPQQISFYHELGSLWMEKAENERLAGRDPRQACDNSNQALDESIKRDASDYFAISGKGTIALIMADYYYDCGKNPSKFIEEAEDHFEKAISIRPDDYRTLSNKCYLEILRAGHTFDEKLEATQEINTCKSIMVKIKNMKVESVIDVYNLDLEIEALECLGRISVGNKSLHLYNMKMILDAAKRHAAAFPVVYNYMLVKYHILNCYVFPSRNNALNLMNAYNALCRLGHSISYVIRLYNTTNSLLRENFKSRYLSGMLRNRPVMDN